MPLETYQKFLQYAQGYLELGLLEDAWNTLDQIEPELRTHPAVLKLRLSILYEAKKWKDAAELGQSLCNGLPQDHDVFIQTAFSLHELKETKRAKDILLSAPDSLRKKALFHYNLGCYEAQLGNLDDARAYVQKSIEIDKQFQTIALDDPDLKPLWPVLRLCF